VNINFDDIIEFQPLPVDATDPFDAVEVIIAPSLVGNIDPQHILVKRGTAPFEDYLAAPVTYTHRDRTPAYYFRAIEYTGKWPFIPIDEVSGYYDDVLSLGVTGAANAIDDDPDTGAINSGTGPMQFGYAFDSGHNTGRVFGFAIAYQLLDKLYPTASGATTRNPVNVQISYATEDYMTVGVYPLPVTTNILPTSTPGIIVSGPDEDQRIGIYYALLPPDAFMYEENGGPGVWATQITAEAYGFMAASDFYAVEFYPLVLSSTRLSSFAKPFIRMPKTHPLKITVPYIVTPEAEHTIVGYPGGDYTAVAERHQHIDGNTSIYFEEPGTHEEVKGERAVRGIIERELARAGYNLMMASRR
jgi:hypothetical protein